MKQLSQELGQISGGSTCDFIVTFEYASFYQRSSDSGSFYDANGCSIVDVASFEYGVFFPYDDCGIQPIAFIWDYRSKISHNPACCSSRYQIKILDNHHAMITCQSTLID